MNTFSLRQKLVAHGEDITLLPGKKVGELAPMGLKKGMCAPHLRGGAKRPAKYSAAAKFLDKMFVDCGINALECNNGKEIYGEVSDGTNYTYFTCDGQSITYAGEALHNSEAVFPLILFALRDAATVNEFKEVFTEARTVIESLSHDERDMVMAVARFCDTYEYGIAKQVTNDIVVHENALDMENMKERVKNGDFNPFPLFSDIRKPIFTGIETGRQHAPKAAKATSNSMNEIKDGKYRIGYEWDEQQKLRIPAASSLDSFIPSKTFYSLVSKIHNRLDKVMLRMDSGCNNIDAIGNDYINMFITGKPGTGKTTLAYALGAATNMPVYTIAMTKNTEEDVFQGMNKVVDGSLKFVSTDFLDAYQNGGIIILEEINLPDPSVIMGALGQAIEFPFMLMKDGYIPVRRHPMCVIIGTMNVGTHGSKGVNQALSSRFKQSYILNDPTKEDFIRILTSATGAKKRDANWVYGAYQKVTEYLLSPAVNDEEAALNVTLRGCIGALENMEEGENAKEAVRNTIIGKISEIDLELAEDVYTNVISCLPDLL